MTEELTDKEFDELLSRAPAEQYDYFLQRASETKTLWTLGTEDGTMLITDEEGLEHVPVWPHPRFAAACLPEEAPLQPRPIDLLIWVEQWTPALVEFKQNVAVFPTPEGGGISLPPQRLREDIEERLTQLHQTKLGDLE